MPHSGTRSHRASLLRHRSALVLGLALAWTPAVHAQLLDLSLEQLLDVGVIATPRFAADPRQIPAAVTVLQRRDFERYGWRTLADALQAQPGYVVTSDYTYSYLASRGLATSGDYRARVQVLIDGIRVNENIYDSVNLDAAFPVDVAMIERVEIINGPSASLYGGSALFGVINVVTRKGADLDGSSARVQLGSGNARRAGASWGGTIGGYDVAMNVTTSETAGRTGEFPERAAAGLPWVTAGLDAEQGTKAMLRVSSSSLRMALYATTRHKFVPTGSYGTVFGDAAHRESDTNTLAEIGYTMQLAEGFTWDHRLYHGLYGYTGRFPYDTDTLRFTNEDRAWGKWWGLESGFTWQAAPGHRLTGGIEYRDNYQQSQVNHDIGFGCLENESSMHCADIRYASRQWSAYLQDEITLTPTLRGTLGVRHDHQQDQQDRLAPRVGLTWRVGTGTLKYLYAGAYRNANPYERYYALPGYYEASPDLGPELMRSQEVTWEVPLPRGMQLVSSVYRYRLEGFIDLDDAGEYFSTPSYMTHGLEATLARPSRDGLSYRLSWAWQHSHADPLPVPTLLPAHMLKLNVSTPLPAAGWTGAAELQYYGKRSTVSETHGIGDFGILNLALQFQPAAAAWGLRMGLRDALDRQWEDPVARDDLMEVPRDRVRQLGRTWYAELDLRF